MTAAVCPAGSGLTNFAPRPMKMGIVSPSRYDAEACKMLQSARPRRLTILRYTEKPCFPRAFILEVRHATAEMRMEPAKRVRRYHDSAHA